MESYEQNKRVEEAVKKLIKIEQYSALKRGEIIDLTTKIENVLTDIVACIFCPGNYSSDVEANKTLNKERIELKSLLLNKIDFRYKIESLKDILLVKKPDILENNRHYIHSLIKELDKVRELRNIIAHSPLDISSPEFKAERSKLSNEIDMFQIIEYKKGKAIQHLMKEERIISEINTMKSVLLKLYRFHALIQYDLPLSNDVKQ